MGPPRRRTRAGRIRLATGAAVVAASVVAGCGEGDGGPSVDMTAGEAIVLGVPPCEDEVDELADAACAEAYVLDGVTYLVSGRPVDERVVSDAEVDRQPVADPAVIDEVVTTADRDVIYLRSSQGWHEARSAGS